MDDNRIDKVLATPIVLGSISDETMQQ
jgi:hypothetical protein